MNDIRYPNITGGTEAAQLLQVKSYLHQLVDQLNMTLQDMGGGGYAAQAVTRTTADSKAVSEQEAQSTFNAIKALIIKSADIVNAYYQEINHRLEGVYVAESDFGDFAEHTTQDILANADQIAQLFSNVQTVVSRAWNMILFSKCERSAPSASGVNWSPMIMLDGRPPSNFLFKSSSSLPHANATI